MRASVITATVLAGALLTAAVPTGAWAERAPTPSCIAAGTPYRHVAALASRAGDCCAGRLQCSQFLSTTTVVRPAHDLRT